MAPKNVEEWVYQAVTLGELTIDPQGQIWRVARRGGNRWTGGTVTHHLLPRRAEHDNGHYLMIRTMIDGKRHYALAHRLVWRHLHGPIPPGLTVNHKNGDKKDNRPANLELATYSEQALHARRVLGRGRDQEGERNAMAKLTAAQVQEIRRLRVEGLTLSQIANRYPVTYQTISKIINGDRWRSTS